MISGHYFKRIRNRRRVRRVDAQSNQEALLALLSSCVIERFARISDVNALAVSLTLRGPEEAEDPPPNPCHPACADYAHTDYCRESWQLHLAELRRRPETHWHKCDHRRLCAYVPIVYHDECLAAVKLACPASMAKEAFECQVELLDALVRDFVISEGDFLGRLVRAEHAAAEFSAPFPPSIDKPVEQPSSHPQVLLALRYLEEHLPDPKLTVACVARELGIHPHYLSHLFADQVGQRMSQFIAGRRVDLAKTLLATTDWQIKRIARETGHANPNWFCFVFRTFAGVTPGQYRRTSRGHGRTAAGR